MGKARTSLRAAIGLAAFVCLATGAARRHKVYEEGGDFGVLVFERVPEVRLVEFATYGGVYSHDGRMVRHAWAVADEGKQKCPT